MTFAQTVVLGLGHYAACSKARYDGRPKVFVSTHQSPPEIVQKALDTRVEKLPPYSLDELDNLIRCADLGPDATKELREYLRLFRAEHPQLLRWDKIQKTSNFLTKKALLQEDNIDAVLCGFFSPNNSLALGAHKAAEFPITPAQYGVSLRPQTNLNFEKHWISTPEPPTAIYFEFPYLWVAFKSTAIYYTLNDNFTPRGWNQDTSINELSKGDVVRCIEGSSHGGTRAQIGTEDGFIINFDNRRKTKDQWKSHSVTLYGAITAISDLPNSTSYVVAGTDGGNLYLVDCDKETEDPIAKVDTEISGLVSFGGSPNLNDKKQYVLVSTISGAMYFVEITEGKVFDCQSGIKPGKNSLWNASSGAQKILGILSIPADKGAAKAIDVHQYQASAV